MINSLTQVVQLRDCFQYRNPLADVIPVIAAMISTGSILSVAASGETVHHDLVQM
jgi:hypothetical protein